MIRIVNAVLVLLASTAAVAEPPPFVAESAGEGRSVYLVPGLSSPGWVWDDLAGRLHDAGYRTHVLTLAGFAGQPPLGGEAFLPRVREALAEALAADDGPEPVVVGHSLGGFLAFWLGATESEHLAGIVAVDGVPYYSALAGASITPDRQRAAAEQMRAFLASMTAEQFLQQNRMSLGAMLASDAHRDRLVADTSRSDPETVARAMFEMMTIDLRPEMAEVEVPTVLIQAADSGADDALRTAYARQVAEIPDHRHVIAGQGRHFVQLDDPDFVAEQVLSLLEEIEEAGHE